MINVVLPLGRNNQQAASGIKLLFNQQVELKLSVYYKVYHFKANVAGCPCPILQSTINGASWIIVQNESLLHKKVVFNDPYNECILQIINVMQDFVSAMIISPRN